MQSTIKCNESQIESTKKILERLDLEARELFESGNIDPESETYKTAVKRHYSLLCKIFQEEIIYGSPYMF